MPFVDALTTILDPSLPLTVIEWDEWGDPLHDPEVYAYMKSYAPYENVADPALPGRSTRSPRSTTPGSTTSSRPSGSPGCATRCRPHATILFKCEMSAGHGGASGRYDAWRETADYYAWIIDTAGAITSTRRSDVGHRA